MSSAFGPKKMVKGPKETFLAHSFCVRKPKNVGENGAELVGGEYMHCLTVQCYPILIEIYLYAHVLFVFFFIIVPLKKRDICLYAYV